MHADQKLYLVFEFLDMDLKRYIDTGNQHGTPITLDIVKVNAVPSISVPSASASGCVHSQVCPLAHSGCSL